MKSNNSTLKNSLKVAAIVKNMLLKSFNGQRLQPVFVGIANRRSAFLHLNKVIIATVFSLLFSLKGFADYTVASGTTIDASTITGQTGILTINGRLNISSNVSLTGFTSIIVNAPNGQIYWTSNSDLILAASTTISINSSAPGLQPTTGNGNASQRLIVGSTVISVSSDNANNAAFSFEQFNTLGGLPKFTITGNTTACAGSPITLTITPDKTSSVSYTYKWSINPASGTFSNNNTVSLTSATTTISPATGNYTITCAVSATGDPLATNSVNVAISAIPTVPSSISATPTTICSGASSNLKATGSGSSIKWYTVSTGGTNIGSSANGADFTVTPAVTTTYYAESSNAGGCSSASRTAVTVSVNAATSITTQPATSAICVGSNATISVVAAGTSPTYQWQLSTTGINGVYSNLTNTAPYSTVTTANLGIATSTSTIGSNYYRAVVTGTCGSVNSNPIAVQYKNTWTGTTSTDWNITSNWSDNQLPSTSCSDVYIQNTVNQPILNSGIATITNLNILSGASLTVNNTGTLQIAGTITNNGVFNVKDGKLELNGTTAQTIAADLFQDSTLNNLVVSNTALNIAASPAKALRITGVISFTKSNSTLNTNDNLILASTVTNTARVADMTNGNVLTGNKFTGKVTVERFYPQSRAWRLVTTPLSNTGSIFDNWQNAGVYAAGKGMFVTGPAPSGNAVGGNGLDASGYNNYSMKGWDANTNAYVNVANTKTRNLAGDANPLTPGKAMNIGYYAFVRGDRSRTPDNTVYGNGNTTTLSSKGYLQTGTQTVDFVGGTGATPTFALVGNPYASAIDFAKITKTNVKPSAFYVYDPSIGSIGLFVTMIEDPSHPGTFMNFLGSTQTGNIQSSQAFFVQAAASGAASVTFNETNKTSDYNSRLFRPATPATDIHSLRINLLQSNVDNSTLLVDGAFAQFDDQFDDKVTMDEDALKFANTSENLGFMRYKQFLVVERRPMLKDTDTLFLQLTKTTQRNYRFEFVPTNIDPLLSAFLEDSYTGKSTPLNLNGTFSADFTVNADAKSSVANRFRIVFKQVAATLPVTFKKISATAKAGNAEVAFTVENEINIKKYEIEKSTDGVSFVKAATIAASGANTITTTYSWLDESTVAGNNFYRVRSIGMDGKMDYTNTVLVKMDKVNAGGVRIYPNPVTDNIIGAEFKNMTVGMYNVRLLNTQGQVILTKKINHTQGNSMEYIQPDYKMLPGIYQLEVAAPNNEITMVKVIVK